MGEHVTEDGIIKIPDAAPLPEMLGFINFRQRGTIRYLDDPIFGDVLTHSGYASGLMSKSPRRQNWIWRPVGADNIKIYHELLGYPTATVQEWYDKSWI